MKLNDRLKKLKTMTEEDELIEAYFFKILVDMEREIKNDKAKEVLIFPVNTREIDEYLHGNFDSFLSGLKRKLAQEDLILENDFDKFIVKMT